jgi:hypothetical protein
MRRQQREQEALMQASIESQTSDTQTVWSKLAPILEENMARLRDRDRDALVLRFFENKSIREIATTLGLDERAAQKRVQRALEKLRGSFTRRGITFSAALISSAIAANSVSAAPASVSALAVAAAGRNATESTDLIMRGAFKAMLWAKVKFALSVGAAALLIGAVTTIGLTQWSSKLAAAPTNDLAAITPATPGPSALIVVGLLASDAPEPIEALAAQTKNNLVARGWAADHVEILSGKVTREQILKKLHAFASSTRDEFWLVLLGQCGKAQGGVPAFQVAGPRLTAPDLKAALDARPPVCFYRHRQRRRFSPSAARRTPHRAFRHAGGKRAGPAAFPAGVGEGICRHAQGTAGRDRRARRRRRGRTMQARQHGAI